MNLAESYRVLGLPFGASFEEIKASYRRLARECHPDVNPGDLRAKERFIQVTQAYQRLLEGVTEEASQPNRPRSSGETVIRKKPSPNPAESASGPKIQFAPNLSETERQLKENSYQQLQHLLRTQRFPRAIALVEGLAQRLPQDPEIKQWQAIVYQRWARELIVANQFDKARTYLKKALRSDPHNRSLWAEVEKDFRQMEQRVSG